MAFPLKLGQPGVITGDGAPSGPQGGVTAANGKAKGQAEVYQGPNPYTAAKS